jgi:hypothetical protein
MRKKGCQIFISDESVVYLTIKPYPIFDLSLNFLHPIHRQGDGPPVSFHLSGE